MNDIYFVFTFYIKISLNDYGISEEEQRQRRQDVDRGQ